MKIWWGKIISPSEGQVDGSLPVYVYVFVEAIHHCQMNSKGEKKREWTNLFTSSPTGHERCQVHMSEIVAHVYVYVEVCVVRRQARAWQRVASKYMAQNEDHLLYARNCIFSSCPFPSFPTIKILSWETTHKHMRQWAHHWLGEDDGRIEAKQSGGARVCWFCSVFGVGRCWSIAVLCRVAIMWSCRVVFWCGVAEWCFGVVLWCCGMVWWSVDLLLPVSAMKICSVSRL